MPADFTAHVVLSFLHARVAVSVSPLISADRERRKRSTIHGIPWIHRCAAGLSTVIRGLAAVVWLVLLPAIVHAQPAIAGTVRDSSGAVLPGVIVQASSPILMGRVRSTWTDGSGQYAIGDLRPGVFTVTFTSSGFHSYRREGIELTGSLVATVNAELSVGDVGETVVVRGDAPAVDARTTRQQASMTSAVVSEIPTGRSLVNLGVLIPGMIAWSPRNQTDVGGTNNLQNMFMAMHGGRISDQRTYVDGVAIRNIQGEGYNPNFTPDMSSVDEVTIDYAAGSAEAITGGVRTNYVPRSGGNTFRVSAFATGADARFQGSNVTSALRARGLIQPDTLKRTYDVNPTGGGPIVRDVLWFYAAARTQSNQNYVGGVFENRNAGDAAAWTYDPDFNRQGLFSITQNSGNVRLTWQPTPRHAFTAFYERQWRVWDEGTFNRSPEAFSRFRFPHNQIGILGWSAPLSNRWLVEARAAYHAEVWRNIGADDLLSNNRSLIPVLDQGGAFPGLMYRAKNGVYAQQSMPFIKVGHAAVSYVNGAYTLTTGVDVLGGTDSNPNSFNDSGLQYRFNNGVPNQITEIAAPYELAWRLTEVGAFAQNRLTIDQLTLNAGVRIDYFGTTFPPSHVGPGPLVPEREISFPETPWYRLKDLSPRLGVVYDLFGDGQTALKASAGRYVVALSPVTGHPVTNLPLSVTRSWRDADDDFTPDCDVRNPLGNGECGMISDLSFGGIGPSTSYDPKILAGWNVRPFNWEISAGVQHELRQGVTVNAGFFRRIYGNFTVLDNRATTAADYTRFRVNAPPDPRLPGGGGYAVDGLFDLNPDKRGVVDNFVTSADTYGHQSETWNGGDFTVDVRTSHLFARGGVSTGRTSTDMCDVAARVPEVLGSGGGLNVRAVPFALDQCGADGDWLTQAKMMASYTMPRIGVTLATAVQSTPGPEIQATYVAPNAIVEPFLGRPLSGGAANTPVTLLTPGTVYGDRLNQLDVRVAKVFHVAGARTVVNLDVYNALNGSAVTALNLNYAGSGAAWLQPQSILPARLFKVGVQFDF